MSRLLCLLVAAVLAAPLPALADSPLTSTDLAAGYDDLPAVAAARQGGPLAGRVLQFLLGPAPNDQKAAVINALGWNFDGQANGRLFVEGLARQHDTTPELLKLKRLTASDRFVLGYLLAMDDYFELKPLKASGRDLWGATPTDLLAQAAHSLPDDFSVHYVRAIVAAQLAMETSWCAVYLGPQEVLDRFEPGRRNMRPAAVESAQSYLSLYADDCGSAAAQPEPSKPPDAYGEREAAVLPSAMYEVYDVDRLGPHVVVGTQGGVVVWDAEKPVPVAWEEEFICSSLVVHDGVAWAGCDSRVIAWDGARFRSYLPNTDNDAEYYSLLRGPGGALFVRYGGQAWRWDSRGRRFAPVELQGSGGYHALYRSNGDYWWIDFLSSIEGPKGTIGLGSKTYPGSDPRRLREDAVGTLWVEDFDRGLYRYDDHTGSFVHHVGLGDKGTGIAVDVERKRTWLLHYTAGVTLQRPGEADLAIDLSDVQYMRDLHLDTDGTVWVGGWGKLVRLKQKGRGFGRTDFGSPE